MQTEFVVRHVPRSSRTGCSGDNWRNPPQTLNTENSHFLQGTLWFPTSLAAPLGHLAEAG